jgi:hypothetical protein
MNEQSDTVPVQVQHYVQQSISSITSDISKVLEDRFTSLKRELAADNPKSIQSVAKKIRSESHEFKSKGNKQQYDHQLKLIDHMEQAKDAIDRCDLPEARAALQNGTDEASTRCKLILLADKSEHGWSTVSKYITDELADNSDDEKRIHKAEKVAEKKAAKRKKDKVTTQRFGPGLPFRRFSPVAPSRNFAQQQLIGPCFKISIIVLVYRGVFQLLHVLYPIHK